MSASKACEQCDLSRSTNLRAQRMCAAHTVRVRYAHSAYALRTQCVCAAHTARVQIAR